MKKIAFPPVFLIFIFSLLVSHVTLAQADKNAAAIQKLETGVNNARNNVAKNEKMMKVADSLINSGTSMVTESKAEAKTIAAERKKLDKEYGTSRKSMEKLSVSRDKAEATKAKADLKALDAKYKIDAKALDNRQKLADKSSSTGAINLSKGKSSKKAAQDGLKVSQESLDAAQAKYDAATNPVEESDNGKKKGK